MKIIPLQKLIFDMPKIEFKKQKRSWSKPKQELFVKIDEIIEDYQEQGYDLTLRQLYYQLVSRDLIENVKEEYGKLSIMINDARYYGLIDWDNIVDRTRNVYKHIEFENVKERLQVSAQNYRKDRHAGQHDHVEIWCEKDALSSILEPIVDKYHLNLIVNRGYSSASYMFQNAVRLAKNSNPGNKNNYILYLGDHDPSGLDMIRDIEDRLNIFGVGNNEYQPCKVIPIALTMDQIKEYNPPPNFAKITDKRADKYIKEFGNKSWEVDALEPSVINELLEDKIEDIIDMKKYNDVIKEEQEDKKKLVELAQNF